MCLYELHNVFLCSGGNRLLYACEVLLFRLLIAGCLQPLCAVFTAVIILPVASLLIFIGKLYGLTTCILINMENVYAGLCIVVICSVYLTVHFSFFSCCHFLTNQGFIHKMLIFYLFLMKNTIEKICYSYFFIKMEIIRNSFRPSVWARTDTSTRQSRCRW